MLLRRLRSEVSSEVMVGASASFCKAAVVDLHTFSDKLNSSFLWGVPPQIPWVNNFKLLSVLLLLYLISLLVISLDLLYSGSLADRYLNTLK